MHSYRIDKANSIHTSLISLAVDVCFLTMCFPLLLLLQALNFPRTLTLLVIRSYIKSYIDSTENKRINYNRRKMLCKGRRIFVTPPTTLLFLFFFWQKTYEQMKSRIDCVARYHSLSILPCRDILNLWIITSIIHYFFVTKVYHVSGTNTSWIQNDEKNDEKNAF